MVQRLPGAGLPANEEVKSTRASTTWKMLSKLMIVTEEDRAKVLKEFNKTPDAVRNDIETIKTWVKMQPHFPEMPADERIEQALITSKFSLEATKKKLDMYYTVRTKFPEFFDRTPKHPSLQAIIKLGCCVPLPKLSPDAHRIVIIKLTDFNPDKFNLLDMAAFAYIFMDAIGAPDYCHGHVAVLDAAGFSLDHVKQVPLMVGKRAYRILEEAFRVRVAKVVVLNAPPFIDMLVTLAKSVLKAKMLDRIEIDKGTELLLKLYPKDMIPEDYGGDERPLKELFEGWDEFITSMDPWFQSRLGLKVDERLRTAPLMENDLFGLEGTFSKLEID